MNNSELQDELQKINQAIAAQEALRGTLPDEQLEAGLTPLRRRQAELNAQLSGMRDVGVGQSQSSAAASQMGGIRAGRIEADNVVQGMQQLGGDLTDAANAVALAEALSSGTITADSIEAQNVVAGFQYISDPAQATPDELRLEIARLREQLAQAVAAGELEAGADLDDAQEALAKAETELAEEQPQGSRIKRKLKEAADILTEGASVTDAARKGGIALLKLAPVAAALYQVASQMFGG